MNALSDLAHSMPRSRPSERHWQERSELAYPLLLVLALLLVLPATFGGPLLHDSFAIDWVWADQFTQELARGTLYPRWLPLSNAGLGSPVFYYYPPLAFHLTGVIGLLGVSTYASIIAGFGVAFAASGIGCWHWLRGRANHPLLGAAFFMAAPYHLFDYAVRGALAESVAIAMIPLLAIGLRRIAERRGGTLLTASSYAAIIMSHLPLALLTSVLLVTPYALAHRRQLQRFAVATVAGIGLAAIYLVPAFALAKYRDLDQLYRSPSFRTDYWSIYAAHWSDVVVVMIFLIVAAIIVAASRPAVMRRDRWAIYAIGIAVLVTGVVPLFWSLPMIRNVQFPYRALPLAEFALATALARLPARPGPALLLSGAPLVLSAFLLPGLGIHPESVGRLRAKHPDVYEYMPKGVMPPGRTDAMLAEIVASRIPPPRVAGMVVEPHFYFPSWSCGTTEPKTKLLMHASSCRPAIVWTAAEKAGALLSLITGLLLVAGVVGRRMRKSGRARSTGGQPIPLY